VVEPGTSGNSPPDWEDRCNQKIPVIHILKKLVLFFFFHDFSCNKGLKLAPRRGPVVVLGWSLVLPTVPTLARLLLTSGLSP
jgi:hypothetical protein